MKTIGERMQEQIEAREQAARAREAAAAAAEEMKRQQRIETVRHAFTATKQRVITAVEVNEPYKATRLPSAFEESGLYGITISDHRHPLHAIWLEFAAWLDENGLTGSVVYAHDGMGMESWHEVRIRPKGW